MDLLISIDDTGNQAYGHWFNGEAPMKHPVGLISPVACSAEQVRCLCGQLVARLVDSGIELKCKRCRRLMTIPFARIEGFPSKLLN